MNFCSRAIAALTSITEGCNHEYEADMAEGAANIDFAND
jgi:hypothetical protein